MPIIEKISAQPISQPQEQKPIPVRTVVTRPPQAKVQNSGQPPITEPIGAAESVPAAESVKLTPQMSAIARKEQAFRQKEAELKERERLVEAKLKSADEYEVLKQKLSAKDFSEAEKLGLNYEEYTTFKLNQQGGEDPQALAIKELKAEIDALKKGSEEQAVIQYEETVAEYKREIAKLVSDVPDFSSIKELKREDAVLQLILDSFEQDGEELTIAEAAKLVEDQLMTMGKAFSGLPKFKKEVEPTPQEKVLPRPVVGKTLTNDMLAGSSGKPAYKPLHLLSESERYAEARRRVIEKRQRQG